jgi:predicted transcriptional regulator of viral defense system
LSTALVRVTSWSCRTGDTLRVHPQLRAIADARLGIFTSREALAVGYTVDDVRAELRTRRWVRLRKGVYVSADVVLAADERQRHLLDCVAVLLCLGPGPVLSHASAARLHDLVIPRKEPRDVRVTAVDQWRRGRGYRVARAALPDDDVVPWVGFGTTSVPRTLVDCAREWSLTAGVVAMDDAMHRLGVDRADIHCAVLAGSHRVGIGGAARALDLSDGRAESPLETRGRLAMLAAGLPRPELQVEIHDDAGLVGRVDAWYEEAAVAVEFDGRVKYLDPRDGRSAGEVVWEEKRREDRMRDTGVRVVRVVNEELGPVWSRKAARIQALLDTPYVGERRFRTVRSAEPGRGSDAA